MPQWMWPRDPQTGQPTNPADITDPAIRDQALNDFLFYVNEQETLRTQAQQGGRQSGNQSWLDQLDPDGGIRMAAQQHAGTYTPPDGNPPPPPGGNTPPPPPPPPPGNPRAGRITRTYQRNASNPDTQAPAPAPPPPPPAPAPATPPGTTPPSTSPPNPAGSPANPAGGNTVVPPAGAVSSRYRRRQNRIQPPGANPGGSVPPIVP